MDTITSTRAVYARDAAHRRKDDGSRVPAKRSMYASTLEVAEAGERYWGRLESWGTWEWVGGTWVEVGTPGARKAKGSARRRPSEVVR